MNAARKFRRILLVAILAATAALSMEGCRTTVAGNPVMIRVGQRMPGVVTQDPDGESQYQPPLEAEDGRWLLIIRAQY